MCRATNWEPQAKCCGAAFARSRGAALSLLFFCRRFLFQIKRKCRNAGSIHPLIRVRSEGETNYQWITIAKPCIGCADSGQPQGLSLRSVKSKITCRLRGIGASRSPHPTKYETISHCKFRERIISARIVYVLFIDLSKTKLIPQSTLRVSSSPTGEPK